MHTLDGWMQGPGYVRGEKSIDRLVKLASSHSYECVDVAVAYASTAGVDQFEKKVLGALQNAEDVEKRWLVSIDFGQSHPDALERLLTMPGSQLRVPDGQRLLTAKLMPQQCFHPKTYLFRQKPPLREPASFLTGSANLTLGGMYGNTEQGVSASVWGKMRPQDTRALRIVTDISAWWDFAWVRADVVDHAFINAYRKLQYKSPVIQDLDKTSIELTTQKPTEVSLSDSASWASSNRFWIETGQLYKNNGANKPGNQLDCRAGTRVFFGFPPDTVPRNTIFGNTVLQFKGCIPVLRSVRYGNNQMDKVNLPMPGGNTGPATYDHQCLLFTRTGMGRFSMCFVTPKQQTTLRNRSKKLGLFYKLGNQNGREYGFC